MIELIVEGHGEVQSAPTLIRRLLYEVLSVYDVYVSDQPIRCNRSDIPIEREFVDLTLIARSRDPQAVVILFDSDGSCASSLVPKLYQWAQPLLPGKPIAIVMAKWEYEAWFVAALESLRGVAGISLDAAYSGDPETKQNPKAILTSFRSKNVPYSPTVDQLAFTKEFDLKLAYRRAPSFRKLVKELCRILTEMGHEPTIPGGWDT